MKSKSKKPDLCCVSFKDSVKEGRIIRAKGFDETEWYFPEWFHLYYFAEQISKEKDLERYEEIRTNNCYSSGKLKRQYLYGKNQDSF
jgi:hypothetical protein